jgi:predicted RNase H-like HicB family nuclease
VTLSAILTVVPQGGFVAFNPETGTATQGETLDEAVRNLKEAAELYFDDLLSSPTETEKVVMFRCTLA